MNEKELKKIYLKWLKNGCMMTDWGLMEWVGKNYILVEKPKIKKK